MKIQKSVLAFALLLVLGAAWAGAAPAASEPAAPAAAAEVAAPAAAVAPAAALPANLAADCAADNVITKASLDYVCGSCSQSPCQGASVNSVCGFASGKFKYCQDWLGSTCPADGNARCRCSSDPIP